MGSPFLGKCPYRPSQKSLSPQHVESITENSNCTQLQTSTDHGGVQLQWMLLHHNSFSYGSRNTEEEESIDCKTHSTRTSVTKQCLLEMAA